MATARVASCMLLVLFSLPLILAQRPGYTGGSYEEELMRRKYEYQQQQQQRLRQQQQQAQQEAMRLQQQRQQQALLRQMQQAQQDANYGQLNGKNGKPTLMSKAEKKKMEQQKKDAAARQKKDAKARQKAFAAAEKAAGRRAAARGGKPKRSGPLAFLLSFKGIVLVSFTAYLYFAQRALLLSVASGIVKGCWNLLFKPLLKAILSLRPGRGEQLPGGNY